MNYPYRYIHKGIATKTGCGPYVASTTIVARTEIVIEMLRLYRKEHQIGPFQELWQYGIWTDLISRKRCAIIITSPKFFPSKEESEGFNHVDIAKEITSLWRAHKWAAYKSGLWEQEQDAD